MNIPPKYEDVVARLDAALAREAALRESLTDKREEYNKIGYRYDALQQRLTVAEQLLRDAKFLIEHSSYRICGASALIFGIEAALKPAEEGGGS